MDVFLAIENLYSTIGGGQSFFQDLVKTSPEHRFWYPVSEPIDARFLPKNVRALQIDHVYRRYHDAARFADADFSIGGISMARCEGAFLFLMDMALAAAGHRFDIVEIPDFLHLGALLPFALRHFGVGFDRVVLSMHGTLSDALTDNCQSDDAFQHSVGELFEGLLYRTADIRYGISQTYVSEWTRRTGREGLLFDLTTTIDLEAFRRLRSRRSARILGVPGRPVRPKIAFIGRQERWKGPDLFVDLVSDLPAECHEGALLVGPSVRLGEVELADRVDPAGRTARHCSRACAIYAERSVETNGVQRLDSTAALS